MAAAILSLKDELDSQSDNHDNKWEIVKAVMIKADKAGTNALMVMEVARKTVVAVVQHLRRAEGTVKDLETSVKVIEARMVASTLGISPAASTRGVGDEWADLIGRAAPLAGLPALVPETIALSAQVKELSGAVSELQTQLEQEGVEVGGIGVRSHHHMMVLGYYPPSGTEVWSCSWTRCPSWSRLHRGGVSTNQNDLISNQNDSYIKKMLF